MSDVGDQLPGIFQGLFGNSGAPYKDAFNAYAPYQQQGINGLNPFANMGKNAIPQFQQWLQKMQNPTDFINGITSQYKQSPWAQNLQKANINAGTNAASASGLTGSTPFAQQLQSNSNQISSQDQNNWLQNVLGVNTQYGSGLGSEISGGQSAQDMISKMFSDFGNNAGQAAYGEKAGQQQDQNALWASLSKLF